MIKVLRVTDFCNDLISEEEDFDLHLEGLLKDIQNEGAIIKDIKYSTNVPNWNTEDMQGLKSGEIGNFVVHSALIIYDDMEKIEEEEKSDK